MIREGVDAVSFEGVAPPPEVPPKELRLLRHGVKPHVASGVLGHSTPLQNSSGDACRMPTSAGEDAKLLATPTGGVPCRSSFQVNNSGLATKGLLPLARRTRSARAGVPRKSLVDLDGVLRFSMAKRN